MSGYDRKAVEREIGAFERGRLDRRQLMRRMMALGVTAGVAAATARAGLGARQAFAAEIDGPEQRAWELAKQSAATAEKKVLTILHPTGSVGNMTPYVDLWKSELGIDTEFIEEPDEVVHTKGMQEAVAKTGRYDVMMPTAMSYADWMESGLIYDLTDWVDQHRPDLFDPDHGVVFPASHHAQLYKGHVAGLLCDGDQFTMLCRSDFLNDSAKQAAFEDRYGYALATPKTWTEYADQVKFFHDPDAGFAGSLEYRSRYYVKWMFMQRFVSKGHLWFDADMNPNFDNDAGVQVLEEMLALNEYLHPNSFSFTWSSNYNAFGRGEGYVNIVWPSGFKYAKAPSTGPATTGNIAPTVMPAEMLSDGNALHASMFTWGYGYTVSKYSKIPALAYAYIQWMTSPTRSADAIPYLGGYSDPYRVNHMLAPTQRLIDTYSPTYLQTLYDNIVNTVPDFCMPGGFEYQDALDKEVHACMTGTKSPKRALADASRQIDRITRRIGRDSQREVWHALVKNLAAPIKAASGADRWT